MVNVVVRHPEHEEARQFDASQEEKVQMTVIVLNRADGVQGEVVRDACLIPYELGS
ncbi:hypothetical protein AAC389_06905 [Rhodococcus qingshengii]|uniref:hypothetical protein n=1 Tax=Rhodococcus qingshengii TaxID=334542 RepID=UPI00311CB2AD